MAVPATVQSHSELAQSLGGVGGLVGGGMGGLDGDGGLDGGSDSLFALAAIIEQEARDRHVS